MLDAPPRLSSPGSTALRGTVLSADAGLPQLLLGDRADDVEVAATTLGQPRLAEALEHDGAALAARV